MYTKSISYKDEETDLTGMFIWDEEHSEKRPGVMIIHGGSGLDDHAKKQAARLSKFGVVAFACDMYGDGVAGDRIKVMSLLKLLTSEPERLLQRANAGLSILRDHPLVNGQIVVVGYCFGGLVALEIARSGVDIKGAISIHGSLHTTQSYSPGSIKAKVLVLHGALDPHISMEQVSGFAEEMTRAGSDWQLLVFGGAKHGFTHEGISALPGIEYNALADARSLHTIHDFFSELFDEKG